MDIASNPPASAAPEGLQRLALAALDGLTAHVCLLDAAGRILTVNRAWREFALRNDGKPSRLGKGVSYLAVCESACGSGQAEARAFAAGLREVLMGRREVFEQEYACHSPAEQRWFVVTVSRIEHCAPACVVVSHQPIAARRVAEERLRDAQRMESLGSLAGEVAHDFNNCLSAMLGCTALALQDLGAGHPAAAQLERVLKSGRRARALVAQIQAFSGRKPHLLAVHPLRSVVEEAVALLQATLPAQVTLRTAWPDQAVFARIDAAQIGQVIMNLGTNAWHALRGDRQGHIEIGLAVGPLPAEHAGGLGLSPELLYAHLWVSDDGVGIDDAIQARIFEPFFTTRCRGHGVGLGLAVVHGIVSEHQGAIHVESSPGQGSSFHVYLPNCAGPDPAEAPPTHRPPWRHGGGRRVLVVDDDEVVGALAQSLLEREGYRVHRALSAAEGLAHVRSDLQSCDLVVSDFNMPGQTGTDLAASVAGLRPGLPVILMTGQVSQDVLDRARQSGVLAIVRKEFAFEELASAANAVLAGRSTRYVLGGSDGAS